MKYQLSNEPAEFTLADLKAGQLCMLLDDDSIHKRVWMRANYGIPGSSSVRMVCIANGDLLPKRLGEVHDFKDYTPVLRVQLTEPMKLEVVKC